MGVKQTEALKLARDVMKHTRNCLYQSLAQDEVVCDCGVTMARAAIREALAEQETVLPGGGHVPAVPVAVYGYCPECGGAGVMRERRPNGDDKCTNGHKYPSSKALAEQPAQTMFLQSRGAGYGPAPSQRLEIGKTEQPAQGDTK